MKKKNCFWIVYKSLPKKQRKEFLRWHFWAWMMEKHPKVFDWCDKFLPFNTLPF